MYTITDIKWVNDDLFFATVKDEHGTILLRARLDHCVNWVKSMVKAMETRQV